MIGQALLQLLQCWAMKAYYRSQISQFFFTEEDVIVDDGTTSINAACSTNELTITIYMVERILF